MAIIAGCVGCAATGPDDNGLPKIGGTYNAPMVISGSPERDQIALAAADDQLTEADWKILEKMGPRPIWQQITGNKKRSDALRKAGDKDDVPDIHGTQPIGPGADGTMPVPVVNEADLPITNMDAPEGKSRFIWVLRSYGGSNVATSRDASTSRRSVTLSAPDLAPLVAVVTQQLGAAGTIVALPRENTLIITCDTAIKPQVLQLLSSLDIPANQVEIAVKIFEVSQNFDFQQGANLVLNRLADDGTQSLISTFSAKRFANAAAGTTPNGSALQLMKVFQDAGVSVDFTFQLLAESGLIQVVSSPRMTVAVGQTGYMLAGQELPIQSANFVNNILQTTTQYKPVGVQLYITPQTASGNRVKLHTISIVSSVSGFAPLPTMDENNTPRKLINPIIDSREAETAVTIGIGDTLVISGLRMVRSTTQEEKIPGLGDIPGIEWMFKNHRTQQRITDLYFFVTPTMLPTTRVTAAVP